MKFVDTNVLIYAAGLHPEARRKTALARDILAMPDICLSVQVLNEFFDRSVRKSRPVYLADHEARSFLETLSSTTVTPVTREMHMHALDIRANTAYRFYDCVIIAAAIATGCIVVLSEDMQHGRAFGQLTLENPFRGL